MGLKTFFIYPFVNWLRPVMFSILAFPLFILSIYIDVPLIQLLGFIVFLLALLGLLISIIVLLFKKQWGKSFYTFLVLAAIFIAFALLGVN